MCWLGFGLKPWLWPGFSWLWLHVFQAKAKPLGLGLALAWPWLRPWLGYKKVNISKKSKN
jgi:hypothetical protein